MIIVGEKINTTREKVQEAVAKRDKKYIQNLALKQASAGAHLIDVNAGTFIHNEPEVLSWLVKTVQEILDLPLCLDSPNPHALASALSQHKGKPMLNSITAEKERFNNLIPLIKEYPCQVVGLCMDDNGIPPTWKERINIAEFLCEKLTEVGVQEDDIFIDPLIQPISSGTNFGLEALETIRQLTERKPKVHKICGLSNISFGLPSRKLLNSTFMVLAIAAGLDAVILDPLDSSIMAKIYATKALLGQDKYCKNYLMAHRKGKLV